MARVPEGFAIHVCQRPCQGSRRHCCRALQGVASKGVINESKLVYFSVNRTILNIQLSTSADSPNPLMDASNKLQCD